MRDRTGVFGDAVSLISLTGACLSEAGPRASERVWSLIKHIVASNARLYTRGPLVLTRLVAALFF